MVYSLYDVAVDWVDAAYNDKLLEEVKDKARLYERLYQGFQDAYEDFMEIAEDNIENVGGTPVGNTSQD